MPPPSSRRFSIPITLLLILLHHLGDVGGGVPEETIIAEMILFDTQRKSSFMEIPWSREVIKETLNKKVRQPGSEVTRDDERNYFTNIQLGSMKTKALGFGALDDQLQVVAALEVPSLYLAVERAVRELVAGEDYRGNVTNLEVLLLVRRLHILQCSE